MIGLDSNVLLRLIVDDDPAQSTRAARFVEARCSRENPGFVDRVALCETVWVLMRAYRFGRAETASVVADLLASTDIVIEDRDMVRTALSRFERNAADFADALIGLVNRSRGCTATATFDRRAGGMDEFVAVP
jgi:predicted nucleic-acid-binding protein